MQILVNADIKSTKRGIFQQKTSKITQSWSKQFWIPTANISLTLQYEIFNLKPKTQLKTLNPITKANIPINTKKWKKSCSQFPSFKSEQYLSTRPKTCKHLKSSSFFKSAQARNTFQARARSSTSKCNNRLYEQHSKHKYYSIQSRVSKDS